MSRSANLGCTPRPHQLVPTFIAAYGARTGKLGGFTADLISFASPARVLAWALNTDPFAPPHARDVANTTH